MRDGVDTVLRLVAEGRLTAEEAAPILDAVEAEPAPKDRGADRSSGANVPPPPGSAAYHDPGPTALRIEVRDDGRQVVNLRLPLALGRFAMDRVPGLTGEHASRIREALRHGVKGPIVEVDEGDGDGVRIVLE